MDRRVRHADPARPPDLQAEAAVRSVRGPRRVPPLQESGRPGQETPMTRKRFERLVEDALRLIPKRFRDEMRNVAVVVEDEPPHPIPHQMQIPTHAPQFPPLPPT